MVKRRQFKLQSPTLKYYHYKEIRALYFGNDMSNKVLKQDWDDEQRDGDVEYRRKRESDMQKVLDCAVRFLTDSEFQCFYLFYFSDTPQEQIADLMDISQPMVNKFLKKSVEKIRCNIFIEQKQLMFDFSF